MHPSTPLIAIASIVTVFMSTGSLWAEKVKANRTEINAFIKADTNADQKLNKSEFRTFVNLMATAGQPAAKRIRFFRAYGFAFSIVDKDKNGILSPIELRTADNDFRSGKL
ncbi:hypothetical protein [Cohaesibacter gelatinilyticus]|uniref:EF hand n=1 Tax=Cohaesibacter gelatinilyticus TaxID=372072 RepID=A0A285PE24_9HYPH|nr:hypothetical protein [Cohaesibacter gelatinilyticus]SNZ19493.1 EF hand [Cohaesibacter gelatinilyticus]